MEDLTFDESEKLLDAWRKSNFIQFNNWVLKWEKFVWIGK